MSHIRRRDPGEPPVYRMACDWPGCNAVHTPDPLPHTADQARAAARYVGEALQDELDQRAATTCKARDARIAELIKERDGLLATLQQVQAILDRRIRPYSTAHAHDCMYAVAEIQRLLNPHREDPDV